MLALNRQNFSKEVFSKTKAAASQTRRLQRLFYGSNFHFEEMLAVALADEVAAFWFVFDHQNFLGSANFHQFPFHFRSGDKRRADSCIFCIINQQNFIKDDFVTLFIFASNFFNFNRVSNGDLVLLAASLNNCKFHNLYILHDFFLNARTAPHFSV